jgi:hypothetical protein
MDWIKVTIIVNFLEIPLPGPRLKPMSIFCPFGGFGLSIRQLALVIGVYDDTP